MMHQAKRSCYITPIFFLWTKLHENLLLAEAVAQRSSVKKVLLEISQNSQENTCARVFFLIKLQALLLSL